MLTASKYLIPKLRSEDWSSGDVCWASLVQSYLQVLKADPAKSKKTPEAALFYTGQNKAEGKLLPSPMGKNMLYGVGKEVAHISKKSDPEKYTGAGDAALLLLLQITVPHQWISTHTMIGQKRVCATSMSTKAKSLFTRWLPFYNQALLT